MAKKRASKKFIPSPVALPYILAIDRRRTEWFDPVLSYANGKTDDDAFPAPFDFQLPTLSGDWDCNIHEDASDEGLEDPISAIQKILSDLVDNKGVTEKIWAELSELVDEVELLGITYLSGEPGEYLTVGAATIGTLEQWLSLLIAELIHRGLGDRVRVCALPRCDNFFIDWKTRGRHQEYCCTNHGSQARVQRKRIEDKKRQML